MADNTDKVLALVEAELKKNPDASTADLQDATKKKFPSTGKLSRRQFNAKYTLQIKRRKPGSGKPAAKKSSAGKATAAVKRAAARATARPRTRKPAAAVPASSADREAVRAQFLRFASDITAAESRKDLVRVLANVDRYVDAVVKAAG